jgi:hypothetical protein
MTDSASHLNDRALLSLYAKFQEQRRSLGTLCPQAFYYDFIDRGRYDGSAMLAIPAAQDHMSEIANSINRLHYDIHSVMAWERTLASLPEEDQWQALFEFVFPLASFSLSSPYSIKQKFIMSVYEVSYHTNRFADLQFREKFNDRPRYQDAERMAQKFSSWTALSTKLEALSDKEFSQVSSDYRNRFHHGFPPTIVVGYRTMLRPMSSGSFSIETAPPLSIAHVTSMVFEQCETALDAYEAYVELIREQEKFWAI